MCCDKYSVGVCGCLPLNYDLCWFQTARAPMQICLSGNMNRFISTDNIVSDAGTAFDIHQHDQKFKSIFASIVIIQMNHLKACGAHV